jgi:hypothetical protein
MTYILHCASCGAICIKRNATKNKGRIEGTQYYD